MNTTPIPDPGSNPDPGPDPIPSVLKAIMSGRKPSGEELEAALHPILRGEAEDVQVAGLLVGLATQPVDGPTLAAAARVLRTHRVAVPSEVRPLIDTCGTGGDGSGTFNISTAAALVVSAAGGAVAKHGNRGVSSKVGSADVLEALGCRLDLSPTAASDLLNATGFVFLFAPSFHPAMRHVGPVRKALGVRTIFNLLGPLSNPALAEHQLLGVFDPSYTRPMAVALAELGSTGAIVVHCDGMDEIGISSPTHVAELKNGEVSSYTITPSDFGMETASLEELKVDSAEQSLATIQAVLAGRVGARLWIMRAIQARSQIHPSVKNLQIGMSPRKGTS